MHSNAFIHAGFDAMKTVRTPTLSLRMRLPSLAFPIHPTAIVSKHPALGLEELCLRVSSVAHLRICS